ncbi:MAG: LPS export ABC transporter periplasmic protein LptC [Rhodospirillaceae bacterium]|nr:MAG: LPS export ABC transporter periplasmic protein LptC [Rhodospirillaceae bacterium]
MTVDSGKVTPAKDQPSSQVSGHVHSDVLWQPREVSAKASVAQYSRFVGRMKIALPVVAGLILLLVLLLPQFRAENERFRVGVKTLTDITSDTLSMINARYVGTDDQGRPYAITAASARERSSADKAIDLVSPKADLITGDGNWLKVSATTGVYDRNLQVLDLAGQVDVYQQQGYEVHSTAAHVSIKDRSATGDQPVSGKGSFGTIAAAGFSITGNGTMVNFTGPVTLVLNGHRNHVPPANADAKTTLPPDAEHKP